MEFICKDVAVKVSAGPESGFQLTERPSLIHEGIHVKHPLICFLICERDCFRGVRLTGLY